MRRILFRNLSYSLQRFESNAAFQTSPSTKITELEKFEQFNWWNEQEHIGSLRNLNPVRCQFVHTIASSWFKTGTQSLATPLKGRSVIDIGCGGGIFSESLGRFGGDVLGIDVVHHNIQIAKKHLVLDPVLSQRIHYQCISAEKIAEQGLQFDLVVASEVIEHVNNPDEFLKTLSKLMKSEGLLCITTLNRTMQSWIAAIFVAERVLQMLPLGTHSWDAFITPEELSMAGRQIGLKMEHIAGFRLNPLNQKWKLVDDTSVNYGATFSKIYHNTPSP